MKQSNPIIVINANMGSKGHQLGRLIASCTNVLWYDDSSNGSNPWEPCNGILNYQLSKFHFDRRFSDNSTIPPVLDFAKRSGLVERPNIPYNLCTKNNYLIYVTHSNLKESREYFNGKHVVVLNADIKRFFATSWNFRVGKTKELISDLYTIKDVHTMLEGTLDSYKAHLSNEDFVISSVDDLLDVQAFKELCSKFNLQFNKEAYNKVCRFIKQ